MSKSIIHISILGLAFYACTNDSPKEKSGRNNEAVRYSDTGLSPIQEHNSLKPVHPYDTFDHIELDTQYFPGYEKEFLKILRTGVFHEDEVWPSASREKWIGLFHSDGKYYLAPTQITTKRTYDAILDADSTRKTGWEVNTLNKDESILLMSAFDGLINRKFEGNVLTQTEIFPGDTITLKQGETTFRFFATGGIIDHRSENGLFQIWNYKLYMQGVKEGKMVTELIFATPQFDDEMADIIFAGDIDGDKIPDLIIDTSSHYNVSILTLYLSRPADKGHLLKVGGHHTSVGC